MSAGWVAGSVRARAMTQRRLGRAAARDLAASPSPEAALSTLRSGPYGHDVRGSESLAAAQRAVVATFAWNVRVLAGWTPREGVPVLRALLGALEIANVEDLLARLAGGEPQPPYRLGGLATAWPRLATAETPDELRGRLAASPWGDPGGSTPRDVGLAMRTALADRWLAVVPEAVSWAAGATALLLARELPEPLPPAARLRAARVVGPRATTAGSLPELVAALPPTARWALADVDGPSGLWRAEGRWWTRLEAQGLVLARRSSAGVEVVVGAVAVLAADAWRVRAALEVAAGGGRAVEAFDAVA